MGKGTVNPDGDIKNILAEQHAKSSHVSATLVFLWVERQSPSLLQHDKARDKAHDKV
jgi:hypothetical protein